MFRKLNPLTGEFASTAPAMKAADITTHISGAVILSDKPGCLAMALACGNGVFGGKVGIDSFTELRWITVETQPGHFPI